MLGCAQQGCAVVRLSLGDKPHEGKAWLGWRLVGESGRGIGIDLLEYGPRKGLQFAAMISGLPDLRARSNLLHAPTFLVSLSCLRLIFSDKPLPKAMYRKV
jgi:hypothetical protein